MRTAGLTVAAGALLLSALSRSAGVSAAQSQPIDYARDIRPLFRQHCYDCHGPDRSRAELRLDRKDRALTGGGAGRGITPGHGDQSRLVRLVLRLDYEPPMRRRGDPLMPAQIELLRARIDQRA